MPYKPENIPPFITRDNLAFEQGAKFQLQLDYQTISTSPITIVGMTKSGSFTFKIVPAGTGGEEAKVFTLNDVPIFVSVVDFNFSNAQGQCYVRLDLLVNGDDVLQLCSGYIYAGQSVSWPYTNLAPSVSTTGEPILITGSNPAANVEISQSVPSSFAWKIKSVRFTLVTDGNAATRQVHLVFKDNSGVIFLDVPAASTQILSLTRNYNFAPGIQNLGTPLDSEINTDIPDNIYMKTDWIIATTTTNRQATDNYGVPIIYVERELVII